MNMIPYRKTDSVKKGESKDTDKNCKKPTYIECNPETTPFQ